MMTRKTLVCMSLAILCLGACKKNDNSPTYDVIVPKGQKPSWAPDITPQMQTVIEALDTLAPVPFYTLTPQMARLEPGAADAVKRVMANYHLTSPARTVDTTGRDIAVTGGLIHLRIYTPNTGKSSYPVIVYYHGGGWVIANNDTYDASAAALSMKTGAVLVAVEYRKGPEFKFPTAHNDAFQAYQWVLKNAPSISGDSTKVVVAGESAGGNMAVTVAMQARDSGLALPVHVLSVYPVASKDPQTASKLQYPDAKPLGTPALPWFLSHYLSDMGQAADTRIDLVNATLTGLPPTTIIGAELDPLQSEGKELADKLSTAGVNTTYHLYKGVTHEFFGMAEVLPEAKAAQELAVAQLMKYF